uniref:Uncharacterized protein n=1 Tax=Brassica oleracea var. oleracea TaxID=109376 RepID=A0A0D3BQR7_BRAOL
MFLDMSKARADLKTKSKHHQSSKLESSSLDLESSSPELESSSPEPLMFSEGKVTRVAFFSLSLVFFRLCKGVLSVNLGPTELRDKRFKVTTIEAGGAPAGGAGGAAGGAGTSGAAGGGKGGSAAGQGQPKK